MRCCARPTRRIFASWGFSLPEHGLPKDRLPKHRVAVVGAGQFGKNHCRVVHESPRAELCAVVDSDAARAAEAAALYHAEALTDFRELAGKVEAAVVAVPTI